NYLEAVGFSTNFPTVLSSPLGDFTYAQPFLAIDGEKVEDPDWYDVNDQGVLRFVIPKTAVNEERKYSCHTDFVITFTLTFTTPEGGASEHFFIPNDEFVVKMLDRYNTF